MEIGIDEGRARTKGALEPTELHLDQRDGGTRTRDLPRTWMYSDSAVDPSQTGRIRTDDLVLPKHAE